MFALDAAARIKTLSKGQKARAGLLVALAHRPELLVLDEPSSGLDPIVRRDILGAVIRTIAHEGRTVLFSSHLFAAIERRFNVSVGAPYDILPALNRFTRALFRLRQGLLQSTVVRQPNTNK